MVSVNRMEKKQPKATEAPSGRTGIPKAVQAKFETASGLSFEDVRVHYNSSRPAQLGAYAYTRGSQVYIGPGQERYLEHELGHVVQQKRGLVKPDGYINGLPVNRDPKLERAADAGANQPVQGVFKSGDGIVQTMLGGRGDGGPVPELRQQGQAPQRQAPQRRGQAQQRQAPRRRRQAQQVQPQQVQAGIPGQHTVQYNGQQHSVYRGQPRAGGIFQATDQDVRVDRETGLLRTSHGISTSVSAEALSRFGTVYLITGIPNDLMLIQRGQNREHFEIVPAREMTMEDYQNALLQITYRVHDPQ